MKPIVGSSNLIHKENEAEMCCLFSKWEARGLLGVCSGRDIHRLLKLEGPRFVSELPRRACRRVRRKLQFFAGKCSVAERPLFAIL